MLRIDLSSLPHDEILSIAKAELDKKPADWEKAIWNFLHTWFGHQDKSIEVFSSGSTGPPKLIVHSKAAMLNSARMTCEALTLKHGSAAFLCLPANKISGMMMIVRCIYNKMTLYCLEPSLSPLSALPAGVQIDFASFTPAQFYEIVDNESAFERAQHIGKIILGGEEIRGALKEKIRLVKNEVYSTFGMTETISHIALKRLNGPVPDKYYKTLPGVSISSGENNCLVIEAPGLEQAHLQTNDVVKIINPHEFEWLGRKDNIINSGGIKVNPVEIESQLAALIGIPFFIGGVSDSRLGQRLVLIAEGEELKPEELSRIKAAVGQINQPYRPKEMRLIPEFARTENGKIKRSESLMKEIFKRIEI